jgi:L-lactate dehydrogenase (cytochrome)
MGGIAAALTVDDLKRMARRRVPRMFFEYADSGSYGEATYRANEADFQKVLLRQRIARKLSQRTLRTQLVGEDAAMPVALAPIGLAGMQHADGEMLAARAAEKFGVPFTLSTMSICSIEDVASVTRRPFWIQLYVMRDQGFVRDLLDRARAAGVSTLVLTMDLQLLAQRHKDLRNQLSAPPRFTPGHVLQMITRPGWCLGMLRTRRRTFRNVVGHARGVSDLSSLGAWIGEQFDPELSWSDVAWIKEYWGRKLVIKGVLDAEDAKAAVDTGADALIVSNHGGRQLDGTVSSIRALPEIVAAVGDRIEVHLDGGVRTGTDVLRARALGAKGVHVGRAFVYGLGAGGEAGVARVLEILRAELDVAMALTGERDINEVGPHIIHSLGFAGALADHRQ